MKRTVCILVPLVCGFSLTRIDFPRDSHPFQIVPLEKSAPGRGRPCHGCVFLGSIEPANSASLYLGTSLPLPLPLQVEQPSRGPQFTIPNSPARLTIPKARSLTRNLPACLSLLPCRELHNAQCVTASSTVSTQPLPPDPQQQRPARHKPEHTAFRTVQVEFGRLCDVTLAANGLWLQPLPLLPFLPPTLQPNPPAHLSGQQWE